jgi:dienelactone hydrolase
VLPLGVYTLGMTAQRGLLAVIAVGGVPAEPTLFVSVKMGVVPSIVASDCAVARRGSVLMRYVKSSRVSSLHSGHGHSLGAAARILTQLCCLHLLFVVLLASAGAVDQDQWEGPHLPRPTGKYPIGTQVLLLSDGSRPNPIAAMGPREIQVQIWYPAAQIGGARQPYAPKSLVDLFEKQEYMDIPREQLERWRPLQTSASTAVPPNAGRFPLLIFGHGAGLSRVSYSAFAQELASLGYIIVAIDFPEGGLGVYPNGRVTTFEPAANDEELDRRVNAFVRDASFVLDSLLIAKGPLARFGPRISKGTVAIGGHSLGGMVALSAPLFDRRFKASIDLDGSPVGRVVQDGLARPTLIVLNEPDAAHRPPEKIGLERDREFTDVINKRGTVADLVVVSGTTHLSFTDLPFLVPPSMFAKHGATTSPEDVVQITTRLVDRFLRVYLIGEPESVLESIERTYSSSIKVRHFPTSTDVGPNKK